MKLTKLASIAMAVTFALGAFSARAAVGVVTNYSLLNIAMTVKTNKASTTTGNITKYTVGTAKVATKDLLGLFESANWANTTFPAGAKIVVGWDTGTWDGQVLVVDKTGTNVLYAVPESGTEYFYLYFYEYGDYTETDNNGDPGSETYSETDMYYVELYDSVNNINLWGYPTSTHQFTQNWDKNGNYTTWSDSESINLGGGMGGDQKVNGNNKGSVSGSIMLTGKGKGLNSFFF